MTNTHKEKQPFVKHLMWLITGALERHTEYNVSKKKEEIIHLVVTLKTG